MPETPLEWLLAIPILMVALVIIALMIVVLPTVGITYYAAGAYVRFVERIGLGD